MTILIPLLSTVMALAPVPPTRAERTDFIETSRYEETLEYCRLLDKASPWIKVTRFGVSPEGRDLILVIASRDKAFDPAAARRTGKPVVLIQAGIHAGEIDGKDAGLILLREIAVTREREALLDHAIILFMPIYNVDGHERFGLYNRINQNGPKEMGWRVNARNLNLNRDYLKADATETRDWLKLFTSWWPDLTIDCHVTDGSDYRYDVTYIYDHGPNVPAPVAAWIDAAVTDRILPALAASGHLTSPYIWPRDDTDPRAGLIQIPATPPRFTHGYTVLQNRPSFLIETHMLKSYDTRVKATLDTLAAWMEEVNRDPESLREAVRQADALASRPGPLAFGVRPAGPPRGEPFLGVEYRRELSAVSGGMRVIYGDEPLTFEVQRQDGYEVTLSVDKPLAYIVPPAWTDAIERLRAHGVTLRRLTSPVTAPFDAYRLSAPTWTATPFEGRHTAAFTTERVAGLTRTFPAGSVVVPMDQRSSAVAAGLLEPQAPDSLAFWGFFDSIFERKEYFEPYVLEKLAREMLDEDPDLRQEFEKALADPAFAGDRNRRLEFFYRRSPWYDDRMGLYPVGLVTIPWDLPTEPLP